MVYFLALENMEGVKIYKEEGYMTIDKTTMTRGSDGRFTVAVKPTESKGNEHVIDEFLNHTYKCLFCNTEFKDRLDYENHCKTEHDVTDEIPYLCSICPRTFYVFAKLRRHVQRTHGPPVEACCICRKAFKEKADLTKHMKSVHLNAKDYVCEECGMGFPFMSHLNRHKLKHQLDERLPCEHCDRVFNTKAELKFHMECHQSSLPAPECGECGKELKNEAQLKRHMREVHPQQQG